MDPALKQMNVSLLRYFHAEKRAGGLFVLIGAAALGLAGWLFASGEHPLRAAFWPLAAIGLLQLIVGAHVYLRTEGQIVQLLGVLNSDPAVYGAAEQLRMEAVMASFAVLRSVEIAVAASGLALLTLGADRAPWCRGAGWGLLVQGVVTFALDFFAERRGADYLAAIRRNMEGRRPAPETSE